MSTSLTKNFRSSYSSIVVSGLRIVQLLFLITLFPVFTLAVNPLGLLDTLPPGTDYYIYTLWPKQVVLAILFSLSIIGSILSLMLNSKNDIGQFISFWKTPGKFMLAFLAIYWSANLYQKRNYQTSYEIWQGQVIHGDGLIWTTMWWLMLPLTSLTFRPLLLRKRGIALIAVIALIIGAFWAILNRIGIDPTVIFNPAMKARDVTAGFGNRSWAGFIFGLYYLLIFIALHRSYAYSSNILGMALLGLCTLAVTITGGRMGVIGVFASISIYLFMNIRQQKASETLRKAVPLLLVTLVVATISYTTGFARAQRLVGMTQFSTDGGFTHRLIPWKAGIRIMTKYPLLGEHSNDTGKLIWRNITPSETKELLTEFAPREVIDSRRYTFSDGSLAIVDDTTHTIKVSSVQFSRFHNQYIELGVRGGILLPIIYIIFMGILGFRLIKSTQVAAVYAGCVLFAYLIYNFTWFTGPIVEPFVFTIIGLGLSFIIPLHDNDRILLKNEGKAQA